MNYYDILFLLKNFRKNSINPYLGKLLPAEEEGGGHSIDDPALTWSKM